MGKRNKRFETQHNGRNNPDFPLLTRQDEVIAARHGKEKSVKMHRVFIFLEMILSLISSRSLTSRAVKYFRQAQCQKPLSSHIETQVLADIMAGKEVIRQSYGYW